jgi:hypothetical protein
MTEDKVRELIRKLETQGDISFEEADDIYSVMGSLSETAAKIISQNPGLENSELQSLLSKDFPVLALEDWHEAVAQKIEDGLSGNFVCSLPFTYGSARLNDCWDSAIEALRKHGSFEDCIIEIQTNRKAHALFPKPFQDLFQWEELEGLYVLRSNRAGLFRYPLRELEGNSISQLFKNLSITSVMPPQERHSTFLGISVTKYAIKYLKQKVPFVQIIAVKPLFGEVSVFTNKTGLPIAKVAFSVSIEELARNAAEQNIIDENDAKKLLRHEGYIKGFPDATFAEVSLKYIDDIIKMKIEWQAAQKAVEREERWLEEIR